MGLIVNDKNVYAIFEESINYLTPKKLQEFFGLFLLSEKILGNLIWNKYKLHFIKDFKDNAEDRGLNEIIKFLSSEDSNLSYKCFGLPEPCLENISNISENYDCKINWKEEYEKMFEKFNNDQKNIFNTITKNKNNMYLKDGQVVQVKQLFLL